MTTIEKLIVYACPTGELAQQIEAYDAETRRLVGPNSAHQYMPHCTLTGFFHDDRLAVPRYLAALSAVLDRARPTKPAPVVTVGQLCLKPDWHYLPLTSPWLRDLTRDFAVEADSETRQEALRLKDDLHLSLAYDYPPEQEQPLARLATKMIDPTTPVGWELRFYEQHPDRSWTCHASWPLD